MDRYDVVIVGGATSGTYFAKKMADRGHTVKIIEALSAEKLGTRMDIFHVTKTDLKTFDMPTVSEGDPAWAFEFTENHFSSPSNIYQVNTVAETVGLHMHEYVALMVSKAVEAGAEIEYSAAFRDFIYEDRKICGVKYESEGEIKHVTARTVIDCSGSHAVCRRSLPDWYGVENFTLQDDDMFYVILRYAKFDTPQINNFWLNTKSWYAPFSMDNTEKIIGTGATGSFENVEKTYAKLDEVTSHGEFELVKTEKGTTPYRRPPYSFVGDNFIVTGDAGCLTKPDCGEGVTSSMVMMDIAADVLDKALRGNDTSAKALWKINTEYNRVQGADFCLVRAFLTKFVNVTDDELEYCFSKGLIFNEEFLNGMKINAGTVLAVAGGVTKALATRKISLSTVDAIASGAKLGIEIRNHYINFPEDPDDFWEWCYKADKLWKKVGKMK